MGRIIQVELKSAVCLAANRGVGNVIPTMDYIPGTTLRGALAERWLEHHNGQLRQEFEELFLGEEVSYPYLFPVKTGGPGRVIPLSALTCKYYSGFVGEAIGLDQAHGVWDAVLPTLRQEAVDTCHCGAPLTRLRGFYHTPKGYEQLYPGKRLLARTAIEESRETAQLGALYSLEVLNESQKFRGELAGGVAEAAGEKLQTLVAKEPIFSLGYARSRGLGEVKISLLSQKHAEVVPLQDRLGQFNEAVLGKDGLAYFCLTLESPAILLDPLLGHRTHPHLEDLKEAAGPMRPTTGLDDFTLVAAWTSPQWITGWQAAWRLPKPDEQAIAMGSVFVFGLANPGAPITDSSRRKELREILSAIEENGLGERITEGFGRVRICHDFHRRPAL